MLFTRALLRRCVCAATSWIPLEPFPIHYQRGKFMENREARSHHLPPVFAACTSRVPVGDYRPYRLGERQWKISL